MVLTANAAVSWSVPTATHPPGVGGQVIDPIRVGLAEFGVDEVVDLHPYRLPGRTPLDALVLVRPDQFLLLRIHADHRIARSEMLIGLVVEVRELGVAVRVL